MEHPARFTGHCSKSQMVLIMQPWKKTHAQLEKDEDGNLIKLSLWHEAAMMTRLCHPNNVAIYGIASSQGNGDDQPIIVMEYMTAHQLENVLHIDKMKFKFLSWRERARANCITSCGWHGVHALHGDHPF